MNAEFIKVWITKYALSTGIEAVDAEVCGEDMVYYGSYGHGNQYAYGNDWHRTPEAALARAEEMRKSRIASLRKSLDKLESMTFSVHKLE